MRHKLVILTIFNPTAIMTHRDSEISEGRILLGFQTYTVLSLSLISIHKGKTFMESFSLPPPHFPCHPICKFFLKLQNSFSIFYYHSITVTVILISFLANAG